MSLRVYNLTDLSPASLLLVSRLPLPPEKMTQLVYTWTWSICQKYTQQIRSQSKREITIVHQFIHTSQSHIWLCDILSDLWHSI